MSRYVTQNNLLKLLPIADNNDKLFYEELKNIHMNQQMQAKRKASNKQVGEVNNPWKKGGECFKLIRSKLDLNQRDFASLIKVSKSTLSTWERGSKQPRYHLLLGIKSILPLEYSKLLKIEEFGYNLTKKNDNPDL